MRAIGILFAGLILSLRSHPQAGAPADPRPGKGQDALIDVLEEELDHSMTHLVSEDGAKPYFLSYSVTDIASTSVRASLGALRRNDAGRARVLDVDLRVGDYALDNTYQIRGGADGGRLGRFFDASASVPLENAPNAVKHTLWQSTDRAFKSAVERYQRVKTDLKTTVEEESKAHDFSREEPSVHSEADAELTLDRAQWAGRIRNVSRLALKHPLIYDSTVAVLGSTENRYLVTSEGTRLKTR